MMRRRSIFVCLLSSLFGMIGCTLKRMPEANLVRVELTRSGTMAGYQYEGRVKQDSAGDFVLRAMKEEYGPLFEKKLSAETMRQFRQIIEEEKMYKYKENYKPMLEVLDGWSWSFSASFEDGTSIFSHGFNASPRGSGLSRIRQLMTELAQDGVEVPSSEEEE